MNNADIEQAIDGLKLQRFWPHEGDIVEDATRALAAIEELQARYKMMTTLADVTAENAAEHLERLTLRYTKLEERNEELQERNRALEVMVERMTSKNDWEILIDMQRDQFKVRKAFKTVMQQLDDAVREAL